MCWGRGSRAEVSTGCENEIESRGENEEKYESKGHWEKVGEPASASPEIGDMCDVRCFGETRVYGAKGDDANDTKDDDDGALVILCENVCGKVKGKTRT
jgi:hypothetical protein